MTTCFKCEGRPAGNDDGAPHSAYCGTCQPRDEQPVPPGSRSCQCAACGANFTSVSAFERHLGTLGSRSPCLDPAARGLVLVSRHSAGRDWLLWAWLAAEDAAGRFGNPKIPAEQAEARMAGTPGPVVASDPRCSGAAA